MKRIVRFVTQINDSNYKHYLLRISNKNFSKNKSYQLIF